MDGLVAGRKGEGRIQVMLDGHYASLSYSCRRYGVARLQTSITSITSSALKRFQESDLIILKR